MLGYAHLQSLLQSVLFSVLLIIKNRRGCLKRDSLFYCLFFLKFDHEVVAVIFGGYDNPSVFGFHCKKLCKAARVDGFAVIPLLFGLHGGTDQFTYFMARVSMASTPSRISFCQLL